MSKDLVLVIDMQNVYDQGGAWHCPGIRDAADRILDLVQSDRAGMDVIFTKFRATDEPTGVWAEYNVQNAEINQDAHANEIMEVFEEAVKLHPVYNKSVYSSLAIPEIRDRIKDYDHIVLTGVVAECCVLSTAMDLIDAGAHVIYLKDAVAGINQNTEQAVEVVLRGLEPLHVELMTTEEYKGRSWAV